MKDRPILWADAGLLSQADSGLRLVTGRVGTSARGDMAQVIPSRMTAEIEGDFVVFLIGMRINKPWMIHKWLPVFLAMPRMLKELEAHPESGFLGHIQSLGVIVRSAV